MDGTRPQQPLTDSQLDRELEMALGVEPSPEFTARVRTLIATEPQPSPWRLASWGRAVAPVAAAAVVGILLAIVVPQVLREERPATPRRPLATSEPPPATALDEDVGKGQPQPTMKAARIVRHERPHSLPLSEPLFSEDERRALVLLVSAVEQGRVPPVPPAQANEETGENSVARIEPLVMEPLPLLTRLGLNRSQAEGERE